MDLPEDLDAAIEIYVAEAMRATGTLRGTAPPPVEVPLPRDDTDRHVIALDESSGGLDFAALFGEPAPPPLPRTRAARGTRSPTGAEPVSFEEDVTTEMNLPPTSAR